MPELKAVPAYSTRWGRAYRAEALEILQLLPSNSVALVLTSPPFALRRKKAYGNVPANEYVEWFWPFAQQIHRILKPDGSFVLDLGGAWNPGSGTRALYQYELILRLTRPQPHQKAESRKQKAEGRKRKAEDNGLLTAECELPTAFHLAQEFYWYNPSKLPTPAEWVTIRRTRVKDAVNMLWWLSKTETPQADNRRVLQPYSRSMRRLLKDGYKVARRPSQHDISPYFQRDNGGAIPPNLLAIPNCRSNDDYFRRCRAAGLPIHPARFPPAIPEFFIRFLTQPKQLVVDPFGGSNVTGQVAEALGRSWISVEINADYVAGSRLRFAHTTAPKLERGDRAA